MRSLQQSLRLAALVAGVLLIPACGQRQAVTIRETGGAWTVVVPQPAGAAEPKPDTEPPRTTPVPRPEPKRVIMPDGSGEMLAADIKKTYQGVTTSLRNGRYWLAAQIVIAGIKVMAIRWEQLRRLATPAD
jgi:hypothetical protein